MKAESKKRIQKQWTRVQQYLGISCSFENARKAYNILDIATAYITLHLRYQKLYIT